MASDFEATVYKGSDLIHDYPCEICGENGINNEADFYCENCSKLLCNNCLKHHNNMYKKHTAFGREDSTKWPVPKGKEYDECPDHHGQKLDLFCTQEKRILCIVCSDESDHKYCACCERIADWITFLHQEGHVRQLTTELDTLREKFIQQKEGLEENIQSLEKTSATILEEIHNLREEINEYLDTVEMNTVSLLDSLLLAVKTSVQEDILVYKQVIEDMNHAHDNMQSMANNSDTLQCSMYSNCHDESFKAELMLHGLTAKKALTIEFKPDTSITELLSTLCDLGKVSKIMQSSTENSTEQDASYSALQENQTNDVNKPDLGSDPNDKNLKGIEYSVIMENDSYLCNITGICETASGEFLLTDYYNKKVKLLDQSYRVVGHCDLPGKPLCICSINTDQAAIAVHAENKLFRKNFICFIRVKNDQLVIERKLKLKHECKGIAHHEGNLYITSGNALYLYSVEGRMVGKMYGDPIGYKKGTVMACTVNRNGDRIYLTNEEYNQLVTIASNGTLISEKNIHVLKRNPKLAQPVPSGLHVTDNGQVLVCGGLSDPNAIVQVNDNGKYLATLATVVTGKDGVKSPTSACYRNQSGALIVGMWNNDSIMVFYTREYYA